MFRAGRTDLARDAGADATSFLLSSGGHISIPPSASREIGVDVSFLQLGVRRSRAVGRVRVHRVARTRGRPTARAVRCVRRSRCAPGSASATPAAPVPPWSRSTAPTSTRTAKWLPAVELATVGGGAAATGWARSASAGAELRVVDALRVFAESGLTSIEFRGDHVRSTPLRLGVALR